MTKLLITIIFSIATMTLVSQTTGFHQFKATDIDGNVVDMSKFKGKKLMVVNVASKCGHTPQYKKLQEIYDRYKAKGFEIIGFPANNFMSQEPGTDSEIKNFCSLNYGVTFTMMSKISVKGEDMSPIYKWLTQKALNGKKESEVQWNFQKYLIDENGNLVKVITPGTQPDDKEITDWIEGK
ncbi:MAG TPA: glutathione peroxidase [Bacteroidales bacterium]|nr:MAG: glutathione peroxidase [Bacteroidetes bacterium GWE2_42_24]OFY31566.1 MAG: glutathione peroxidase [Bacteroidetes bacterium GWF2_43_11]PKP26120.1 MAG: glutathione peroxidase [Bacteroidetes bacterium HGW-Bacteroidetes-22]HAQ65719.1 glutathione peroxidase [Bacteroidales bacterium]HBZ67183.1 glutathione peroxidase [Bacteroidales bacterium]